MVDFLLFCIFRKDDPLEMKNLILKIQNKAAISTGKIVFYLNIVFSVIHSFIKSIYNSFHLFIIDYVIIIYSDLICRRGSRGGLKVRAPLGLLRGGAPPPLKLFARKTRFSVCELNNNVIVYCPSLSLLFGYKYLK